MSFLAEDASPADNSEPELLQRADPEGDADAFGLEEPLCQAVSILLEPSEPQRGARTAALTASSPAC